MARQKLVDGNLVDFTAQEELDRDAEEAQSIIDADTYDKETGFKQERFALLPPQYEVIPALIEAIKTMQDRGTVFPSDVVAVIDSWEAAKVAVPDPV